MKKTYWIIGIIVIIAIIVGYFIYTNMNPWVTNTNKKLINEYPALENGAHLNSQIQGDSDSDFFEDLSEITNGQLSWSNEDNWFKCENGETAEKIRFSNTYYKGGEGFSNVHIIDCGNTYWIFRSGDYGSGSLYGPFEN